MHSLGQDRMTVMYFSSVRLCLSKKDSNVSLNLFSFHIQVTSTRMSRHFFCNFLIPGKCVAKGSKIIVCPIGG